MRVEEVMVVVHVSSLQLTKGWYANSSQVAGNREKYQNLTLPIANLFLSLHGTRSHNDHALLSSSSQGKLFSRLVCSIRPQAASVYHNSPTLCL